MLAQITLRKKNILPNLGQKFLLSSLLGFLALLLVGHLHVVETIERPDAQKLTPEKQHKTHHTNRKDRIFAPIVS